MDVVLGDGFMSINGGPLIEVKGATLHREWDDNACLAENAPSAGDFFEYARQNFAITKKELDEMTRASRCVFPLSRREGLDVFEAAQGPELPLRTTLQQIRLSLEEYWSRSFGLNAKNR